MPYHLRTATFSTDFCTVYGENCCQVDLLLLCLHLPVSFFSPVFLCLAYNANLMDTFGNHSNKCGAFGVEKLRQNTVSDCVFQTCTSGNLAHMLEYSLISDSRHLQGNIVPPMWFNGHIVAIDLTIGSSL